MGIVCAAVFVIANLASRCPVAAFDSFSAATGLNNAAGATIVSDIVQESNLIDPIPPNTAFTSFIGGGSFSANAYVDTNAIIGVAAGMSNRLDKLTSSASFSIDIENTSPFPRRMDLGFLIFPGQLNLIARNAEASFNIEVSVVGNDIDDANGFPPRFTAGGTLQTDASNVTTWTNLPFSANIGLPPDGPNSGFVNIPLRAPTLTSYFGPNAQGNIIYTMSVTIDATAAAAGGGFLEIAQANVSDPLMPGMTDAIESITFFEVPEPATVGLAIVAMVVWVAARLRICRRQAEPDLLQKEGIARRSPPFMAD
jgi:hypothetical protein